MKQYTLAGLMLQQYTLLQVITTIYPFLCVSGLAHDILGH